MRTDVTECGIKPKSYSATALDIVWENECWDTTDNYSLITEDIFPVFSSSPVG